MCVLHLIKIRAQFACVMLCLHVPRALFTPVKPQKPKDLLIRTFVMFFLF